MGQEVKANRFGQMEELEVRMSDPATFWTANDLRVWSEEIFEQSAENLIPDGTQIEVGSVNRMRGFIYIQESGGIWISPSWG